MKSIPITRREKGKKNTQWQKNLLPIFLKFLNGKGGIRTLGDREATPIFKIGAINHSATFPTNNIMYYYHKKIKKSSLL